MHNVGDKILLCIMRFMQQEIGHVMVTTVTWLGKRDKTDFLSWVYASIWCKRVQNLFKNKINACLVVSSQKISKQLVPSSPYKVLPCQISIW